MSSGDMGHTFGEISNTQASSGRTRGMQCEGPSVELRGDDANSSRLVQRLFESSSCLTLGCQFSYCFCRLAPMVSRAFWGPIDKGSEEARREALQLHVPPPHLIRVPAHSSLPRHPDRDHTAGHRVHLCSAGGGADGAPTCAPASQRKRLASGTWPRGVVARTLPSSLWCSVRPRDKGQCTCPPPPHGEGPQPDHGPSLPHRGRGGHTRGARACSIWTSTSALLGTPVYTGGSGFAHVSQGRF